MADLLPGDPMRTLANSVKGVADEVVDAVKGAFGGDTDHPPLKTVDHVDLTRYAGRWYELARLPITFQSDQAVSIAEYSLNDDGSVKVHNISYEGGENTKRHDIEGTATIAEGAEDSQARLKVKFGGMAALAPTPDEGNYWVLKLTDDYTMALVGSPDRKTMWLLARDTSGGITDQAHDWLVWAAEQGYETTKLLFDNWETNTAAPRETQD